jgi:hypothetical protein
MRLYREINQSRRNLIAPDSSSEILDEVIAFEAFYIIPIVGIEAITTFHPKESQKDSFSVTAISVEEEDLLFSRVVVDIAGKMSNGFSPVGEVLERSLGFSYEERGCQASLSIRLTK